MNKLWNVVVFAFVITASSFAQSGTTVLNQLRDKFNSVAGFSADFSEVIGGKVKNTGKFSYAKGDKFRLELKNSTVISDGSTIWNYNQSQKKVVISSVNVSDPNYFSVGRILNDYPAKTEVTASPDGVLTLTPKKDSGLNFTSVRIWKNSDNLIRKIEINSSSGKMEIELSGYKLNQNIDENNFSFTPPKGIKVIDLR